MIDGELQDLHQDSAVGVEGTAYAPANYVHNTIDMTQRLPIIWPRIRLIDHTREDLHAAADI